MCPSLGKVAVVCVTQAQDVGVDVIVSVAVALVLVLVIVRFSATVVRPRLVNDLRTTA